MKQKRLGALFMAVVLSIFTLAGSFTALAATRLETVTGLWWDDKIASWDEVEDAYRYEVTLYRNGSTVTTIKASKAKYNFAAKFSKEGDYTFRVRALKKGSQFTDGAWSARSESYTIDAAHAKELKEESQNKSETKSGNSGPGGTESVASWKQDDKGWWYTNADGSFSTNKWQQISDKWYFFGADGYMKTGWVGWNGLWYYCGSDGVMWTNADTPDGFHVDENGVMK